MLLCVLGIAIVALHQSRRMVAEHAARYLLESQGMTVDALRVSEIGGTAALVEGVRLTGPDLSAERIEILYDAAGLSRSRISEVRLDGLRLDVSAGLAEIEEMLAGGAGGDTSLAVDLITVTNGTLILGPPFAGTVTIDGSLRPSGEGAVAELDAVLDLSALTGKVRLSSDGLATGALIAVTGEAALDLGELARIADLAETGSGQGRVVLEFEGSAAAPTGMDPFSALTEALTLAGRLRVEDARIGAESAISGELDWSLEGRDGEVALQLTPPSRLEAAGIDLAALGIIGGNLDERILTEIAGAGAEVRWRPLGPGGELGVRAALRLSRGEAVADLNLMARSVHNADMSLSQDAAASFEVAAAAIDLSRPDWSARLDAFGWQGEAIILPDGRLEISGPASAQLSEARLASTRMAAATFEGDLRVAGMASDWALEAAAGTSLAIEGLVSPGVAAIEGRVAAEVEEARVSGGDSGVKLALAARLGPFGAVLDAEDGPVAIEDIEARVVVTGDDAATGDASLSEVAARLPEQAVELSDGTATITRHGSGDATDISVAAAIRDIARAQRFAPAELELSGTLQGEALAASGAVALTGTGVSIPIELVGDLAGPNAEARLGPAPLAFRRSGLQPAALSPLLASVRDVDGRVTLDGTISVAAGSAPETRLLLRFDDVAARSADTDVEGLSGTLGLSSLSPLASAGTQRLRARRVVAGVPLTDADLRFSIAPARRGHAIRIRTAAAGLAGGTVGLAETTWVTGASGNAVRVSLEGVSLERLLRDWHIEGVSGTGVLSGSLPLEFAGGGVGVTGGVLASGGPGVVQVDWGGARETLVGAGQQVELAVRALEDFHYEILSVGVDQVPGGEMTLAIRLEGANPDVLDGHPFNFNINLSGELDRILAAVREGRRIGAGLLRGGIGSSP